MDGIKYLLKFGKREHIDQFAAGSLYCSNAVTFWEIEKEKKIKGQGDILEAGQKVYAQAMKMVNPITGETTVMVRDTTGLVHIAPAAKMPVFCMFAVHDCDCSITDGAFHLTSDTKELIMLILHKSYTSTILGVIPRGKSLPRQGFYCFYDTPR